ncbi:hypothetical protein CLAIMM_02184 [Cladophialophora immunda]|nr:hypothetical protein CLAIMM_02184 [Cladophialophora immunda]
MAPAGSQRCTSFQPPEKEDTLGKAAHPSVTLSSHGTHKNARTFLFRSHKHTKLAVLRGATNPLEDQPSDRKVNKFGSPREVKERDREGLTQGPKRWLKDNGQQTTDNRRQTTPKGQAGCR